jgi:hypothetical protein
MSKVALFGSIGLNDSPTTRRRKRCMRMFLLLQLLSRSDAVSCGFILSDEVRVPSSS